MAERQSAGSGSPFGCLGCITTILVLWALLFSVTWGGKHYNVGCSCSRGVEVTP